MIPFLHSKSIIDWKKSLEENNTDRCDFDILLKDEWRHKIVMRGNTRSPYKVQTCCIILQNNEYKKIESFILSDKNNILLKSAALLSFHAALQAYGHGTQSAIAFTNILDNNTADEVSVIPSFVDHLQLSNDTIEASLKLCTEFLLSFEKRFGSNMSFDYSFFDASISVTEKEYTLPNESYFPLNLVMFYNKNHQSIHVTLGYASNFINEKVIGGIVNVFKEILLQLVSGQDILFNNIELLSKQEKAQLLKWNKTDAAFPEELRLNNLFEHAAAKNASAEALIYKNRKLTYCELDAVANYIANQLLSKEIQIKSDEFVALYLDKTDTVISLILGIWKSGAAIVPIDTNYTDERVQFIVSDSAARFIITNARYKEKLERVLEKDKERINIITIESLLPGKIELQNSSFVKPSLFLKSTTKAYMTYTSGTTGVPKGVSKTHKSVVNSIVDLSNRYKMRESGTERVALFASYVFEPFIRQTLIALINGQILVVVPDEIRLDPEYFPKFLNEQRITYLNGTGSVLVHFDLKKATSLKKLILVGEELTQAGINQLREKFLGHIINEYAFTEAAFVTAVKEFRPGEKKRQDRSVGKPINNVKCYVLSQNMKYLPIGAIGELYVGGLGIAGKYHNRDALTKERFLANPFQTEEEKKLGVNSIIYKTGDLARILPNGEFEYMGRQDFQLKINGVRIEPGEIEAKAMLFPGVKKCVVMTKTGTQGTQTLVGYFTIEKDSTVTEEKLFKYLEENLIHVMVPAKLIKLEEFPVNINGKIDRKSLQDISGSKVFIDTNQNNEEIVDQLALEVDVILRKSWSDILGIESKKISKISDFFQLGASSVSSILLIGHIRKNFDLTLKVQDIFQLRSFEKLADHIKQMMLKNKHQELIYKDIERTLTLEESKLLPANGVQQGLLYHMLRTKSTDDAYIMQSVYTYNSKIDSSLLKRAWEIIFVKYPSLRLQFTWEEEALQIVGSKDKEINWYYQDISNEASYEIQLMQIKNLQQDDRKKHFDLSEGPLFRVYLLKQKENLYTLIFSCHHIILDGWSLALLHDEVHHIYMSLLKGERVDYLEDNAYIEAQHYLAKHSKDSIEYWSNKLKNIGERCDLRGLLQSKKRYKVDLNLYDKVIEHREKIYTFGKSLSDKIRNFCASNSLTFHSVLQFVWHKTLHTIGAGQTTIVGTIVSGRNIPVGGIEKSLGLYINTLPLIVDHDSQKNKTLLEAITSIQQQTNLLNDYCIVALGQIENGTMKRSLFDTLLTLEDFPCFISKEEQEEHQEILKFKHSYDVDKVDHPLALVVRETQGEFIMNLWYAGELFEEEQIDELLNTARAIFNQIHTASELTVDKLNLCAKRSLAQLDNWNKTGCYFDTKITLDRVFEKVADKWPNEVAVVYEDDQLSYRELDQKSNQLAHKLLEIKSLLPNEFVGLVLDKNINMIISILAVWKAGLAYVPVDPDFPDERIAFMLEDTKTQIVIANSQYIQHIKLLVQPSISIVDIDTISLQSYPTSAPLTSVTSHDLAYAIYTSGTTGKPKAVLVEHIGVVNLQNSLKKTFALGKEDGDKAFLSFSNYVFDHFIEQMTDAILNGQKLVILNDDMRADQARLLEYISKNEVTYLSGTPSVLSLYDFTEAKSLKYIDAIGEDFTEPVFNKIRKTFKGIIINGYGPTEVSITTHKRPYNSSEPRNNKSIGYLVDNIKCYVLNESMKLVPIGGIGELYLGGVGVARGYLNRIDLTTERFLKNPFQTSKELESGENARIYKTGDLVRWLSNGELEYLGRTDHQVKIRGYRIELGEIESILTSYTGISRAVILFREHKEDDTEGIIQKYLIGFYLSDKEIEELDLKKWMRSKLPEAVVPLRLIRIDNIPVTVNGKLDIKSLPDIDFMQCVNQNSTTLTSDTEFCLGEIWSSILKIPVDSLSKESDFFGLGGDSIRAISLAQKIKNKFNCKFLVTSVFEHVTLQDQAKYIEKLLGIEDVAKSQYGNNETSISEASVIVPVSLSQQRLLFINEFEGRSAAYNITFFLKIEKCDHQLKQRLQLSFQTLLQRHSALRTLFKKTKKGSWVQEILNAVTATPLLKIKDLSNLKEDQLDAILIQEEEYVFSLEHELPINIGFFRKFTEPNTLYVSIVVHHLCFDGWSWNIFLHELTSLYFGNTHNKLPELQSTYADYATLQQKEEMFGAFEVLEDFWKNYLLGAEPAQLPEDKIRPHHFDYLGREGFFTIDESTTQQLKHLARFCKVSLYSILLAAYGLMVKVFSGQDDFIIGTPSANRDQPEYENVIGFFVNLLPIRILIDSNYSIQNYIKSVSSSLLKAQIHKNMPFEKIIQCLGYERDSSRNPVVQMIFTLQNTEDLQKNNRTHCSLYKPDNKGYTKTKFDITTILCEEDNKLLGSFTFAIALYDNYSVERFISTFQTILSEFTRLSFALDTAKIKDINIGLPSKALDRSYEDTGGQVVHTNKITLDRVFEKVADKWPNEVAVVYEDDQLSYRELDQKSNQLAHKLLEIKSLLPNEFVGLVLDKNINMIISILAVWKAGLAYVPVDPDFPDERIAFMLEDTKTQIVIANSQYIQHIKLLVQPSISIVDIDTISLQSYPTSAPLTSVTSHDLAYAIYTSGTTGKPKAVLVEHGSLFSFLGSIQTKYFEPRLANSENEVIFFTSNYIFDFSLEQILLSLMCGNCLIIPKKQHSFENAEFYNFANKNKLTYISGTPTQIHQIDFKKLQHIRTVVVAGEPFLDYHFKKIQDTYTGCLYSAYGTTETTVYNSVHEFDLQAAYINDLGAPLQNTLFYILDNDLKKLPDGAVGELCISGDCVAREYLNQLTLAKDRFLQNPYQLEINDKNRAFSRIYRTGDLVRKLADGRIKYIGRNDTQVKVNGVRIELSEVESVIAEYPAVTQSAAILYSEILGGITKHSIIGYFVTENNIENNAISLMKFLRQKLPPAMIPFKLIQVIDALPLTVNGKLDKNALEHLVIMQKPTKYLSPRNRLDAILCTLWREELRNNNIGIDENFFHIGGDSIKAMMLASKMQQMLNTPIKVKDLFDYPSIKDFVDNVLENTFQEEDPHELFIENYSDEALTGECPLLPIQKWFFFKKLSNIHHWNQYFSIRAPKLDIPTLRNALNTLINYHDAFRLRYTYSTDGNITQFYNTLDVNALSLHILDVSNMSEKDIHTQIEKLQSTFNIEKGPTWCVIYIHGYSDHSSRICFAMHHLIVDTVSWQIIARDLEILYNGGRLGVKSSSYKQWAQIIQNYVPSTEEKQYWNQISLEITDYNKKVRFRDSSDQTNVYYEEFYLSTDDTHALLTECQRAYDTQINDLLLTSVALSLEQVSGKKVNYITLEGHGRTNLKNTIEVRDTVGWFTVMYPYKLELQKDIEQSIFSIKNSRLHIPNGGIGYGTLHGTYGGENMLLPLISFNYLGNLSNKVEIHKDLEQNVWVLDHTLCGISKSKYDKASSDCDIDITMFCVDGRMFVNIKGLWGEDRIKQLTGALKESFNLIINHTKKKKPQNLYNIHYLNKDFEPYIIVNEDKIEKTLFVLPPGEGGAESYLGNIAKHIKNKRLILFNNIHLHQPMKSFEDIAKYYIYHISEIQPEEPYDFLGWSFGGVLALEIALQLSKNNTKINNIVMIDSYFDVRFASQTIGLPHIDNILDPINYYYSPDLNDLKQLSQNLRNVTMLKAMKVNDITTNPHQTQLFDYYMKSPYNNLDRLIPREQILLIELIEDTHHSWVKNERQIEEISTLMSNWGSKRKPQIFPKIFK